MVVRLQPYTLPYPQATDPGLERTGLEVESIYATPGNFTLQLAVRVRRWATPDDGIIIHLSQIRTHDPEPASRIHSLNVSLAGPLCLTATPKGRISE